MLGEQTVNGRVDTDRIDVSQKSGKIDKLTVVVLDSELEMIDMKIHFLASGGRHSGTDFHPPVNHYFRESSRTRAIDLPNAEIIRFIEFKYKNLPGGGKARVQLWGKLGAGGPTSSAPASEPAPRPSGPAWDSSGWTMLGEVVVNGRADKDRIDVSQKSGVMNKLTVVVVDSDLEMVDVLIHFLPQKGRPKAKDFHPEVKQTFREGSRTRAIDLPNAEILRYVEFKYKNLPGGGKAKVQLWGKS